MSNCKTESLWPQKREYNRSILDGEEVIIRMEDWIVEKLEYETKYFRIDRWTTENYTKTTHYSLVESSQSQHTRQQMICYNIKTGELFITPPMEEYVNIFTDKNGIWYQ